MIRFNIRRVHKDVVVCKVGCTEAVQCHTVPVGISLQHRTHISAHQNSLANTEDIYHDGTAPHTYVIHRTACLHHTQT